MRGVLAIYVMLGHALPFTSLPPWLCRPFSHGEAAVDMFFCLSGLVVMNALDRLNGRFWPFMAARARRLLPVYFIVLAVAVVMLAADPIAAMPWVSAAGASFWAAGLPPHFAWHLAAHILLLHGIIPAGLLPFAHITLLAPAWSLSTEWQFYILLGLLAPRRIMPLVLALLAVAAVYRVLALPPWWHFGRAFLPDAAAYFALGLASILLLREGRVVFFLFCLAAACAIGGLAAPEKALVPLAWGVVMLAQYQRWGAVLDTAALQFLGAISYPLYLLNEPVQRGIAIILAPLAHGNAALFTLLWLPPALILPILAAKFLHQTIERPLAGLWRAKAAFPAPCPPAVPRHIPS